MSRKKQARNGLIGALRAAGADIDEPTAERIDELRAENPAVTTTEVIRALGVATEEQIEEARRRVHEKGDQETLIDQMKVARARFKQITDANIRLGRLAEAISEKA